MPNMDYSLLLGRIKERGYTQKSLAEAVGISEGQFCAKLNGKFPFKQTEINRICDTLQIEGDKIGEFFFSPKN